VVASVAPTTAETDVATAFTFTPTTNTVAPLKGDVFKWVNTLAGCTGANEAAPDFWSSTVTYTFSTAGTFYLCYKTEGQTNEAFQIGPSVVVSAAARTCAIPTQPTTVAPAATAAPSDKAAKVEVTITFAGTYDATLHTTTGTFAIALKTAMATSIAGTDAAASVVTEWEGRIAIISMASGSIVVVTEVTPKVGQTINALNDVIASTIVAEVNGGSFTAGGLTATEIKTKVVGGTDKKDDDDSKGSAIPPLALGIILLLAIGLPCLCCGVAIVAFFKCVKGKDQQPQGQQQGATQFV